MAQISLLYPENSSQKTCEMTPQGINDLSIDYIVESLTKDVYEKNSIKNILTNVTSDIDVINYRADVFEDILNFLSFGFYNYHISITLSLDIT